MFDRIKCPRAGETVWNRGGVGSWCFGLVSHRRDEIRGLPGGSQEKPSTGVEEGFSWWVVLPDFTQHSKFLIAGSAFKTFRRWD